MSETITVSGASPVVDVTSSGSRTELTKETLELIPTSRNNYNGLMAQAPGTRTNIDIGGEAFNTAATFHAFGQDNEPWQTLEGIVTVSPKASQTGNYVDYASFEEAKIQTLANDAEIPSRGIAINAVVKSGGNEFHGSGFYAGTSHAFQSENIDATLEAQGIADSSSINLRDDMSGDLGGRIKMNKLWFYGTARQRRDRETIIACFQPDGTPCLNIQGQRFETGKLTWQICPSNKLIGFNQWAQKDNGLRREPAGGVGVARAPGRQSLHAEDRMAGDQGQLARDVVPVRRMAQLHGPGLGPRRGGQGRDDATR